MFFTKFRTITKKNFYKYILVFFLQPGEMIFYAETNSDTFTIDNLKSGIHFVNIITERGNIVHKIIKY